MKNNMKKMLVALFTMSCMFLFAAIPANAAQKTVTKSNKVFYYSNGITKDFYGKDVFQVTYDGNKINRCKYSHGSYDFYSDMFHFVKASYKKNSSSKLTYKTVWQLKMNVLPSFLVPVAKKFTPYIAAIQKIGCIAQVTTTYEVNAKGTVKIVGRSYKWFTTIGSYINSLRKFIKF